MLWRSMLYLNLRVRTSNILTKKKKTKKTKQVPRRFLKKPASLNRVEVKHSSI